MLVGCVLFMRLSISFAMFCHRKLSAIDVVHVPCPDFWNLRSWTAGIVTVLRTGQADAAR